MREETFPQLVRITRDAKHQEVGPGRTYIDAVGCGERGKQTPPLLDERGHPEFHLRTEVECDRSRDLSGHRQVVREQHLFELRDHPGGRDREAESHSRERPDLGIGAHDCQRPRFGYELHRAPSREFPVGLVDHQQRTGAGRRVGQPFDGCARFDGARGIVGTAHEHDRGPRLLDGGDRVVGIDAVIGSALAGHDIGARAPRDLRVQRIRRFEDQRAPSRAAVGEQERLQNLVAAVPAQDSPDRLVEKGTERRSQLGRGAVGIPVPLDVAQRVEPTLQERGGRTVGTLVGVEPDTDVDLR